MVELFVLVPSAVLATIEQGGSWGEMSAQISEPEQLARVVAVSADGGANLLPVEGLNRCHFLSAADTRRVGRWFKVDAATQVAWIHLRQRAGGITLEGFRNLLPAALRNPGEHTYLALTYAPEMPAEYTAAGVPRLAGWAVSSASVCPVVVDIDAPTSSVQ